jgi:hypothetical protein
VAGGTYALALQAVCDILHRCSERIAPSACRSRGARAQPSLPGYRPSSIWVRWSRPRLAPRRPMVALNATPSTHAPARGMTLLDTAAGAAVAAASGVGRAAAHMTGAALLANGSGTGTGMTGPAAANPAIVGAIETQNASGGAGAAAAMICHRGGARTRAAATAARGLGPAHALVAGAMEGTVTATGFARLQGRRRPPPPHPAARRGRGRGSRPTPLAVAAAGLAGGHRACQ